MLARIETSQAFLAYETGSPAAAFRLCAQAARMPGLDQSTLGVIEAQRAMLLLRQGRTRDALVGFAEALGTAHSMRWSAAGHWSTAAASTSTRASLRWLGQTSRRPIDSSHQWRSLCWLRWRSTMPATRTCSRETWSRHSTAWMLRAKCSPMSAHWLRLPASRIELRSYRGRLDRARTGRPEVQQRVSTARIGCISAEGKPSSPSPGLCCTRTPLRR